MSPFRPRIAIALAAALLLAACSGGPGRESLPNISLAGTPNSTRVGLLDNKRERTEMPLNGRAIVAAFRASGCGQPAPDFERMMRGQVKDGLRVPDGLTLYDAGIGHYTSSRCGPNSRLRAIGAYGVKPGTYELGFFGGKVNRTVVVR